MPSPNRIARFYAEENLEKERILSRFIDEITQLPKVTPTAAPVSAAMQTTNTSADRLQNLLRAVAEQTNILALDVAFSEALDERARTGLVKDIAELSRLIQQTAGEAQVKIDPSEAWMAVEQIRPLIGRILLQLELAGPERALPNDSGTVVPFKQHAVDSEGLSALARDLDAMTVGDAQ